MSIVSAVRSAYASGFALTRRAVLAMIKRRPAAAGLPASTCCHTFRATGHLHDVRAPGAHPRAD